MLILADEESFEMLEGTQKYPPQSEPVQGHETSIACKCDYQQAKEYKSDRHRLRRWQCNRKSSRTLCQGTHRFQFLSMFFSPAASTQFWMVAKGTKTR
jgi:hypothetical protein